MYIYKITNKINGKWYIGKTIGKNPNYMGSGKLLKQAQKKYGIENFEKVILEQCSSEEELNKKEIEWISITNARTDSASYNLVEGGEGGDRSNFISYDKIDYSKFKCEGLIARYQSLSELEKRKVQAKRAQKRTKGWYISRIDDPTEFFVQNISKWCEENKISKSFVYRSNNPSDHLFQKQSQGWRFRRSDMPPLDPYSDKRTIGHPNVICKGKTWKYVDNKRVWFDK